MNYLGDVRAPTRANGSAHIKRTMHGTPWSPATPRMLERAKAIIRMEATALERLSDCLDDQICVLADHIMSSSGMVVVSGVGKSRLVGEKISATLASTGTRSIALDPTDAIHGDLGRVRSGDTLLALSKSGETLEIKHLVHAIRQFDVPVAVMTGSSSSSLAQMADIVLSIGSLRETCALGLAPTTTTTAMMALGDALAIVIQERRGFTQRDFARLHPGGSLGRGLMRVCDYMWALDRVPIVTPETPLSRVLIMMCCASLMSKTAVVINDRAEIVGTITVERIRKAMEQGQNAELSDPVAQHMRGPAATIQEDASVADAEKIFLRYGEDLLPVTNRAERLVGVLPCQDIANAH